MIGIEFKCYVNLEIVLFIWRRLDYWDGLRFSLRKCDLFFNWEGIFTFIWVVLEGERGGKLFKL